MNSEKLKDILLWIKHKLTYEISLSAYNMYNSMVSPGPVFKKSSLPKGSCTTVLLKEPALLDLSMGCKCGDGIMGSSSCVDKYCVCMSASGALVGRIAPRSKNGWRYALCK